jgi:hypothetical protein
MTSQDLIRLKAHYQKLEDREFNPDPNYSIQDEYYDNLADEFADEFANYQPTIRDDKVAPPPSLREAVGNQLITDLDYY